MAGGKKGKSQTSRAGKDGYSSSGGMKGKRGEGSSYHSDKRLIPRIKEYLSDHKGRVVDVGEIAAALQAQYSDYSRRRKAPFRNLVVKAYKSLEDSLEAELLQERLEVELEHLRREVMGENQLTGREEGEDASESSPTSCTSEDDSDDEFENSLPQGYNMMNDSLLHVYGTGQPSGSAPQLDTPGSLLKWTSLQDDLDTGTSSGALGARMEAPRGVSADQVGPSAPAVVVETGEQNGEDTGGGSGQGRDGTSPEGVIAPEAPTCDVVVPSTNDADLIHPQGVVCDNHDGIREGGALGTKWPGGKESSCQGQREQVVVVSAENVSTQKVKEKGDGGGEGEKGKEYSRKDTPVVSTMKRTRAAVDEGRDEGEAGGRGKRPGAKRRRTGVIPSELRKKKTVFRDTGGGEGEGVEKTDVESAVKSALGEKRSKEFQVESSSVRFSDVGGCGRCLKEVCKLLCHLRHPEVFARLGVKPPQGFLLHGPPGCGKTLLACAIAGELELPFIRLAATEVVSGVSGESESTIRDLFHLAKSSAPCVLFIDEVDVICPKRETAQREMERRIVTQLMSCLDDLNQSSAEAHVLVVGATSRPDALDPALRRAGRFDREISLGIPDEQARQSILHVLCRGLRLDSGLSFSSLAHRTPGFVGADLLALVREASLCAVNRVLQDINMAVHEAMDIDNPSARSQETTEDLRSHTVPTPLGNLTSAGATAVDVIHQLKELPPLSDEQLDRVFVTSNDFQSALDVVQPSSKREGFVTVPDTTWDDVGALEDVREELSMAILAPVRYPQQFAALGLATPPGILLAGPPGCGKTLLAKAIANETGINFISVKGPELLNMYVGESERAVRQVFQRAKNSSPCVIFFDELDALCPKRSEAAETSASSRVVNQLLTEMDGLETRKQVFIMGATNRPDIIDPAVLRPGRLDKVLYVGLPTAKDRAAIMKTITKGGTKPKMDKDVDFMLLASDQNCHGYSGADLNALVREAAISSLREYMELRPLHQTTLDQSDYPIPNLEGDVIVTMRHFMAALKRIRPSVTDKDRLFYNQMASRLGHGV